MCLLSHVNRFYLSGISEFFISLFTFILELSLSKWKELDKLLKLLKICEIYMAWRIRTKVSITVYFLQDQCAVAPERENASFLAKAYYLEGRPKGKKKATKKPKSVPNKILPLKFQKR